MKTSVTATAENNQPKRPSSQRKIEAARRNGAKSRGPISAAGKLRSSRNAIRHGLSGLKPNVLSVENPTQYKEFVDSFVVNLRPATKAELRIVERIANIEWRLERLTLMESCLRSTTVSGELDSILDRFQAIDGIGLIVASWRATGKATSEYLDLLHRYLVSLQKQLNTAFSNLHHAQLVHENELYLTATTQQPDRKAA